MEPIVTATEIAQQSTMPPGTKELLVGAGFDPTWLAQMEQKYGSAIFQLISDVLAHGFTPAFLIELVQNLEPLVVDIVIKLLSANSAGRAQVAAKMGAGAIFDAEQAAAFSGPVIVALITKLIDLLPSLGISGWQLLAAQGILHLILGLAQKQGS